MGDRVGVVFGESGDERGVVLPDGSMEPVTDDMTDEMIVARFNLDLLRHQPGVEWCSAVCLDGPMRGESVNAVNRIGSSVTVKPSGGSNEPLVKYELVTLASGVSPAELRMVGPASSTD